MQPGWRSGRGCAPKDSKSVSQLVAPTPTIHLAPLPLALLPLLRRREGLPLTLHFNLSLPVSPVNNVRSLLTHTSPLPILALGNSPFSSILRWGPRNLSSGGHCQFIRHGQHLCLHVHAHTPAYARTPAHMCICTHSHTCTHTHTHTQCTCAHIHSHTYTHTDTPLSYEAHGSLPDVFGSDHGYHEAEETDAGPRDLAPAQGNWDTHVCKESICEV